MESDNLTSQKKQPRQVSTVFMRRAVGILGMSLPFILLFGSLLLGDCKEIQQSISNFYHTNMRDVLVGILCAVAFFLVSYLGYKNDYIFFRLAGFFALGIAFFPMNAVHPLPCCNFPPFREFAFVNTLHLISAVSFFLTLSYISLILFTKTHTGKKVEGMKKKRNIIYILCGSIMLFSMVLLLIYFIAFKGKPNIDKLKPVFWLETLALMAFGISWLVKGKTIYKDKPIKN